jgi:hypothetical protein
MLKTAWRKRGVERLGSWIIGTMSGRCVRRAAECLQQRLGILKVGRVKPLGKPAIHRRQQVVSLLVFALGLPQAGQAGGSTQFQRFGLLLAGDVESLLETGLGLGHIQKRRHHPSQMVF